MSKRLFHTIVCLTVLLGGLCVPVLAGSSYSFSYKDKTSSACPDPYYATHLITGESLNVGRFSDVQDVLFDDIRQILYIVDTGNSRLIACNTNTGTVTVIDHFTNTAGRKQTFSKPQGVGINKNGYLAIADTGNHRIVILTPHLTLQQEIVKPDSAYISDEVAFQPTKVLLGDDGRVFCIAAGINAGLMEFGFDGYFVGFSGANKVITSPLELFWKKISTAEMNVGTIQYVPTEFSNLALDPDGFIYTTTASVDKTDPSKSYPVRKQSTSGKNILVSQNWYYPIGDVEYPLSGSDVVGPSTFVDVTVRDDGVYYCLDSKRGRIFTYDAQGNMLFAFGGFGETMGSFCHPTSISTDGVKLYVADADTESVTVFEPATFGNLVLQANACHHSGRYEQEEALWANVLKLDSNYEIGYNGMGKALLYQDRYQEALDYFRIGQNRTYYSKAYALYLKAWFASHAVWLVVSAAVLIVLLVIWNAIVKKRTQREKRPRPAWLAGLIYAFYCMVHPFDGFYDLKHEKRGHPVSAAILWTFLILTLLIQRQCTGFVFNEKSPETLNVLYVAAGALLAVLLWAVANWSITTLVDGEGKFSEILMATLYALLPFCLTQTVMALLSNVFTLNEQAIWTVIQVIGIAWSLFLLFAAMQATHQHNGLQTIICMALTVVGMAVILFLFVLFFNLLQQFADFLIKIYNEVIFRV